MFPHQQPYVPQPIMFVPIQQIQSLQAVQHEQSPYPTAPLGYAIRSVPAPVTTDMPPLANHRVFYDIPSPPSIPNALLIDDTNASVTSPAPVPMSTVPIDTVTSPAPVPSDIATPDLFGIPPTIDTQSDGCTCDQFERVFVRKVDLNTHKRIHTDFAFVCQFCNQIFARKSNLQQHERIHRYERPYPCTYCPRTFRQQHSLKGHLRTHMGEKHHRCIHCNKRFAAKGHLTVHLRTHTRNTQHHCAPCNKIYVSKSGYHVHMRAFHHSVELEANKCHFVSI